MKTTLIYILALFVFMGAGCTKAATVSDLKQNTPPTTQASTKRTQLPNPVMEAAILEINKNIKLTPVQFFCNDEFGCSIPEVSRKWSKMDTDSTCIWTTVCGNGAIPYHTVTTEGRHMLSSEQVCAGVTSILCQDLSGQIYYGEENTKTVPVAE